jgi:membrane fusion protein, multidrug efflux system
MAESELRASRAESRRHLALPNTATLLIVLPLALWGSYRSADAQGAAVVPVGTVLAERKPVAQTMDFVGRVEAINRVEIRARVKGFLESVQFKEGDVVKEGAALYQIEKGLFDAAVQQAQGALERSKAAKVLTVVQLQRAEDLLSRNTGTAVARDQALAADEQAQGAILSDQANLATARINLGYTDIRAPISGKIGRTNITKGNVVGPDSGPLTMIVSQDPMYVTFPVSQREFLRTRETARQADTASIKVRLRFSDGTMYDQTGEINFIDVTVDRTTDTVLARATIPNPKGGLIDGQLMSVVLEAAHPEEKVVIPQAALIADQQGVYVFVVEDGKVAAKRVKPGGNRGPGMMIDQGLSGGEQVIVEGIQRVRPGVAVQAAPMSSTLDRS